MNETILELILTAVMGFFMIFGLIGCWNQKKELKEKEDTSLLENNENENNC